MGEIIFIFGFSLVPLCISLADTYYWFPSLIKLQRKIISEMKMPLNQQF